jgi:hypothetical protein
MTASPAVPPRSATPRLQVRITEEGVDDYVGWLFGTMPSIHPYPHEKYTVVLVEGLPAE